MVECSDRMLTTPWEIEGLISSQIKGGNVNSTKSFCSRCSLIVPFLLPLLVHYLNTVFIIFLMHSDQAYDWWRAGVGTDWLTNSFSLHLIQSDRVRGTPYGISSSSQIIYLKNRQLDITIVHSLFLVWKFIPCLCV